MDYYVWCLVSEKSCKNNFLLMLFSVCWLMLAPTTGGASARQASRTVLNTQYGTANGIDDLSGIDPSADICTTGRPNDGSKIFYFYNVGTGRFLSIGGLWGTHASINNTPNSIWLESTGTDGQYYLNNKIDGSGTGTYLGIKNNNLYMDQGNQGTVKAVFSFEKAEGYTDKNKLYRIKVVVNNVGNYITTNPSNSDLLCNIATSYATTNANYKNQVWKIISNQEYYSLALANPATMRSLLDFSFLMPDADFRINNTDSKCWTLGTEDAAGINPSAVPIYLGDSRMYCTFAERTGTNEKHFGGTYNATHQQNYGKYAYCYSKQLRNFYVY